MTNGIVIYKGKYGSTKQYAEWIAEETGFEILLSDNVYYSKVVNASCIVICSPVYMAKLLIRNWIKHRYLTLQHKKLFFVIVCATSFSEIKKQEKIIKDNIPDVLLPDSDINFLPGRLIIEKLSWKDKMILRLGSWMEKDPVKKAAVRKDIDGVQKENTFCIIDKIRSYTPDETDLLLVEI